MTVGQALASATERLRISGSASPRLDAELLLGHVVGLDRTAILAHPEAPLGAGHEARFEALLARRETGEPVAYIREVKEFYGFALSVDSRALIPRPETELLVELAISRTRAAIGARPRVEGMPRFRVLDVGTGSGAIVVAMARTLRRAGFGDVIRFTASDISEAAVSLAVENAVAQGVADLIDFRVADLLSTAVQIDDPPAVIVANLPYVASADLDALGPAIGFEPRLALDGGLDGLDVIRRMLGELPRVLAHGGVALVEIGSDQGEAAMVAAGVERPD
ncbi:MAG: peptide chain release factor N(5)-glutamine methyltransferase, partial [Candidatus Limnocylindrales bacterium]